VSECRLRVDLAAQTLELIEAGRVVRRFGVSTAANGAGEREGSEQTPRGRHAVAEKIGEGAPSGTVFVGREPTGEVCTPERFRADPGRDWITTRILWLDGQEDGRNRGGDRDSRARYVYIHGTPDEASLGRPASHGCIRMRDADVAWLFDRVEVGTLVEITEEGAERLPANGQGETT
jgi:lipoprotein-anchoring transpeptidase ErfK/SrfK